MSSLKTHVMSLTRVLALLMLGLLASTQTILRANTESKAALWLGTSQGLRKLALQDLSLVLEVADSSETRALVVDELNGRVWAYGNGALNAFGLGGRRLLDIPVPVNEREDEGQDDDCEAESAACAVLVLDPADSSVWLAVGKSLYRYSPEGDREVSRTFSHPVRALALESLQSRLWVGSSKTLTAHDRSGNEVASIRFGNRARLREIAIEPASGDLWVAFKDELSRYDTAGNLLIRKSYEKISRMAPDGNGGMWAAKDDALWRVSSSGKVLFQAHPSKQPGTGKVVDLVVDPKDESLWAVKGRSMAHLSLTGQVLDAGKLRPELQGQGRVFALALYRDMQPPTLRIASPTDGAYLADGMPTLELVFSDAGSGVLPGTLALEANGSPIAVSCSFGQ